MIRLYITGNVKYRAFNMYDYFSDTKPLPLGFISDLRDGVAVDDKGDATLDGFHIIVVSFHDLDVRKNGVLYEITCKVHFDTRDFTFADANRLYESIFPRGIRYYGIPSSFETHVLKCVDVFKAWSVPVCVDLQRKVLEFLVQ
jgi:hypothetical protein